MTRSGTADTADAAVNSTEFELTPRAARPAPVIALRNGPIRIAPHTVNAEPATAPRLSAGGQAGGLLPRPDRASLAVSLGNHVPRPYRAKSW